MTAGGMNTEGKKEQKTSSYIAGSEGSIPCDTDGAS
jgi:hypothetical protein